MIRSPLLELRPLFTIMIHLVLDHSAPVSPSVLSNIFISQQLLRINQISFPLICFNRFLHKRAINLNNCPWQGQCQPTLSTCNSPLIRTTHFDLIEPSYFTQLFLSKVLDKMFTCSCSLSYIKTIFLRFFSLVLNFITAQDQLF